MQRRTLLLLSGAAIVERVFAGDTARKYITRASLKNAAVAVSASGGAKSRPSMVSSSGSAVMAAGVGSRP